MKRSTSSIGHTASPDGGARAILRVPQVLMAVARHGEGAAFSVLQDELQLPKASLHRLLHTLEGAGYLAREDGIYRLGPATSQLARSIARADYGNYPACAQPVIDWLASATGESIILAELTSDRTHVYYRIVVNSSKPLRFTVPSGHTRPLFAAASGQAILASLPEDEREAYFRDTDFTSITQDTLDSTGLRRRIAEVNESGFAFDRHGSFSGAGAFAAPCFDSSGRVACAISIAGPVERLEASASRLGDMVTEAGGRISELLGYRGDYPRKH